MSKIAIIGAGKTGRGFIARLLREAGREILFVDKDGTLVQSLNEAGQFTVRFFGDVREPMTIANYKAVTWENADFSDVELIFTAVCGENLADVGMRLRETLLRDKRYYAIACENAADPAKTLSAAIGMENVFASEATVFCTTIENGGLHIHSENYPYLQCNAALLPGCAPDIPGIRLTPDFGSLLTRKLFTYNAASCIIAYIGALKGYTSYGDAANDPDILRLLDKNYAVTNRVMCRKFGLSMEEQTEFAALSKRKFCDRTIADTIARNAREPHRKLGGAERIIAPIKLMREYGEDAFVLEMTAAAAILYDGEGETKWREIKIQKTNEEILTDICGLEKDGVIYKNILNFIKEFSR